MPADPQLKSNFPRDLERVHTAVESTVIRQFGVARRFRQHLDSLTNYPAGDCLVHDHAVWLPTNHAVASYCRNAKVKRVISPRGMLGDWALNHGRWKKNVAWWLYQGHDLRSADAFHATSRQEAEEIRKLGLRQPIAVIPNGILFSESPEVPTSTRRVESRSVLFLSRIHPKKGLLSLLHAWKEASVPKNWRLILAGPNENGHQTEVENLAKSLEIDAQISFQWAVSDELKWKMYREADLFVLPSFSENFGIVVAEALAAGVPVIATHGTPWQELNERKAGWFVPHNITAIAKALKEAISLDDTARSEIGARGITWARSEFGWDGIAKRMETFYRLLLAGRVELSEDIF